MNKKNLDISIKFSQEALDAILSACKFSYQKGQKVCSSTHLFKILMGNSSTQQLLSKARINDKKIITELEPILKNVSHPMPIRNETVVFSPDLKATILRSYLIAKQISIDKVGLDELFLATLYSPEIYHFVKNLGIDHKDVDNLIISMKGGMGTSDKPQTSLLSRFTENIIEKAQRGELEDIIDRESELAQLTRVLVRKNKNNVILLGETGVGRSSIVHLLTGKILSGEVPTQLRNTKVLELNINTLIAILASRGVNEITEQIKGELEKTEDVIIFIRNLEITSREGSIEKILLSNLLKSIISQSRNRYICTMTSPAYRTLVTKENELASKFEVVKVSEPSLDLSTRILTNVAKKLSQYHKIKISDEVIGASVQLSKRYIQDKFLPSKAIDLLDEASSKVVMENRGEVTVDDIKTVISEKTSIPVEKLTISEQKKLINLEEILNQSIIGQKDAVHTVSEVIRRSRAGLKDPKKPIGSFLFLGPSGVGKTYLAKNLTRIVYDNENAMIRLDMSEFSESHTVQRLIGSPPGYVGYEEGGQLTNPIWERPYSLILLDEIEKAHPKVFDIFLQVLDEGRLTDGQGRTIDFKNTIIIATSNIATDEILEKFPKKESNWEGFDKELLLEQEIIPILSQYFRPEFINRFDEIVIFKPLGLTELAIIARLQIEQIQQRLSEKKITLNVSKEKLQELAQKSYNPAFGARPLIRLIQDQIENTLARKIISGEIKEGETVNL